MIDSILQDQQLHALVRQACAENGLYVDIDSSLLNGDVLNFDKIIILKPDAYYCSKFMVSPPPSIDYIVVVKCTDETYKLYLIELRDCNGSSLVKRKVIEKKFLTIATDFFEKKFPDIFSKDRYKISSIKLWLVADPFNTATIDQEMYEKKIKGTVIEQYLSMKPISVLGKLALIEPILPYIQKPVPRVMPC